jgi:DNA-binding XRE family transcriptional regulator
LFDSSKEGLTKARAVILADWASWLFVLPNAIVRKTYNIFKTKIAVFVNFLYYIFVRQLAVSFFSNQGGVGVTLGDRIKLRRQRLGLTQEELASQANIRRPTISELESNRRTTVSSDIVKRLARALGCSTDYLLGMDDLYEE